MTIKPEDLDHRRRAYQSVFNNSPGKEVLEDLAKYCRVYKKNYEMGMSQLDLAYVAGMKDVYLRIQNHLNISDDDVWQLLNQPKQEKSDYE